MHGTRGFASSSKQTQPVGFYLIAKNQFLRTYKLNGFKTLVSDDYDTVIYEILNYMGETRVACLYCNRKFKSEETLEKHVIFCHRKCDICVGLDQTIDPSDT